MVKSKSHRPDEELLGVLRAQRAEIKRLKRKIRSLEKQLLVTESEEDEENEDIEMCIECGKGQLEIIDIGIRKYSICSVCKNRERIE